jgi:hypothetical protein
MKTHGQDDYLYSLFSTIYYFLAFHLVLGEDTHRPKARNFTQNNWFLEALDH